MSVSQTPPSSYGWLVCLRLVVLTGGILSSPFSFLFLTSTANITDASRKRNGDDIDIDDEDTVHVWARP